MVPSPGMLVRGLGYPSPDPVRKVSIGRTRTTTRLIRR